MSEYEVFYPGQYSDEDKKALDGYKKVCADIEARGPVDPKKLASGELADLPGVGDGFLPVKELKPWEVRYETSNYDPVNPLYNDEEYAKKLGYKTTPTLPLAAILEGNAEPMPAELRDNLVISGLNHIVKFVNPVYPGDTIYTVCNHREVEELTPAGGSELRTFGITGDGCVYNQNGELCTIIRDRVKESLRRHTDPARRNVSPVPVWECPAWWDLRPRHRYTEADWAHIKAVWKKEPQWHDGALKWEDIQVGDHPFEFMEGPVTQLDTIKYHGLSEIGYPSLKVVMKDPMLSQMLIHDEATGEYHKTSGVGHLEDGFVKNHRPCFYNYMPIYFACRAFQAWAGNAAKLDTVAWRIMNNLPGYEKDIPDFPEPDSYIAEVPELAGKSITIHGMVGDLIWIKTYVADKYEENGEKFVKVIFWIQTIEEQIYEEGYVIIKLPM